MGLSENRVYSQWNSHLIGILIINHWVKRGTLFSDTPRLIFWSWHLCCQYGTYDGWCIEPCMVGWGSIAHIASNSDPLAQKHLPQGVILHLLVCNLNWLHNYCNTIESLNVQSGILEKDRNPRRHPVASWFQFTRVSNILWPISVVDILISDIRFCRYL